MRYSLAFPLALLLGGAAAAGNAATTTTAAAAPAVNTNMAKLFTMDSTCDTRDVDSILAEAIDMIKVAQKGIETLLAAKFSLSSASGNVEVEKLMIAAYAAFGVPRPGRFTISLGQDVRDRLQTAHDNYEIVRAALEDGKGISTDRNVFFCDSTNLKWISKDDNADEIFDAVNGVQNGQSLGDFFAAQGSTGLTGLWKDPNHKTGAFWNFIRDEYPTGNKICPDNSGEGITFGGGSTANKNMFICPPAWDSQYYRASLGGLRTSTQSAQWEHVRSTSGVFLHEMMHWVAAQPHIIDQPVDLTLDDGSKVTRAAYGMIKVWTLGQSRPQDLTTNADTYNIFATMAYCPMLNWGI